MQDYHPKLPNISRRLTLHEGCAAPLKPSDKFAGAAHRREASSVQTKSGCENFTLVAVVAADTSSLATVCCTDVAKPERSISLHVIPLNRTALKTLHI
jgi:hypothetical protein